MSSTRGDASMTETPEGGVVALGVAQDSAERKRLPPGCSEPGCRIPPEMASFRGPDGRAWCISHNPDPLPKRKATARGGDAATRRRLKALPPGTPDPDWSTPKAIRTWLEQRGGMIERAELDPRVVPVKLAELAKQ